MNARSCFIDSVDSVQKVLTKEHKIRLKPWKVKDIMKEDLDMKFKKVKPISVHANSAKNLVLRQQFALKLIELLQEGKKILNIDETWLGMCDFRRMKWQPSGSTNSVPKLPVAPRISMITGLDTKG